MIKGLDYYRLFKVDYYAYFYFWIMVLPWFFYPMIFIPDSIISVRDWTMGTVAISSVGFILLMRRINRLKNLHSHGLDIIGYISATYGQEKGGSLVQFTYDYQGLNYRKVNKIKPSVYYRYGFLKGDGIAVRFDPKKPTDAIIRDVFFPTDEFKTSFIVPKLSKAIENRKIIDRNLKIIPDEIKFADVWTSGRIDTVLSLFQFKDTVMEFGRKRYGLNKKGNRIMIRKNLSVEINTARLLNKDIITLEFHRYYYRFYVAYFIFTLIMGFVIQDYVDIRRIGHIVILAMLFPPVALWGLFRSEKGMRFFKFPNYSWEAQRVYFEILNAVRKKENEIL
jgi:hypothetical protein